ncbi:MAG: hypothetical protein WAM26_13310 [Nitrososphaeraceae archaeon]
MTLQNLNKILDRYEEQLGFTNSSNQFEQLHGLPFYDWSIDRGVSNRITTFNNVIGLPHKNGRPMPLFDYEQMLFYTLQTNKHIWIKKATGLGVTEFMLRYMAWLCFAEKNRRFVSGSQMCIVTGPRIELSITLIDRMKGLFRNIFQMQFDSKETVIELNGVHIEAYPSHHLDSMRGLTNVSFIYLDEADFFLSTSRRQGRQ